MSPKVTQAMMDDAKRDGASSISKLKPKPNAISNLAETSNPAVEPKPVKNDELQALRDEISELRAMVEDSKISADKRVQELSAIISALSETKPVRVKPVRDMDPQSKTYLLVAHYDFIPVSYRKLDS